MGSLRVVYGIHFCLVSVPSTKVSGKSACKQGLSRTSVFQYSCQYSCWDAERPSKQGASRIQARHCRKPSTSHYPATVQVLYQEPNRGTPLPSGSASSRARVGALHFLRFLIERSLKLRENLGSPEPLEAVLRRFRGLDAPTQGGSRSRRF